jgi:hypothetical protein
MKSNHEASQSFEREIGNVLRVLKEIQTLFANSLLKFNADHCFLVEERY